MSAYSTSTADTIMAALAGVPTKVVPADTLVLDLDAVTFNDTTDGTPVDFDQGMTVGPGESIVGDGAMTVGVAAGAFNLDLQMGDAAGSQSVRFLDSASVEVARVDSDGNVQCDGDLDVDGTGTSTIAGNLTISGDLTIAGSANKVIAETETMLVADNHIYLNDGYTTAVAETGGLVANYLPTATVDTITAGGFTAGVAAVSNATVTTTGAAVFSLADIIQISGSTGNDGLYEVLSHAANLLTIRGVGLTATVEDFTQNQFDTEAGLGAITQVTVAILRSGTDGIWETAEGSTTGLTFIDLLTVATSTLQIAYEGGNTITTSAAEGDVSIVGDQDFLIGGTVDMTFTGDSATITASTASSFTTAAGALTLTAAAASTWSTAAGALTLTSAAAATWSTAAGALTLTSAAAATWSTAAGDLDIRAGDDLVLLAFTGDIFLAATGEVGTNIAPDAAAGGVTDGDIVIIDSAGDVALADADTIAGNAAPYGVAMSTSGVGVAVELGGVEGQACTVNSDLSAATVGDIVYLSQAAGLVTTTAPTASGSAVVRCGTVQVAAVAGTGRIYWSPQYIAANP